MATLLKCGGLFLHIPKTGGNWVSSVLEANDLVFAHVGGKHAGAPQLAPLERLLQTPHRYDKANRPLFRFCFVRHPLRWYESWYRMNVARGWPEWASDEEAWNPSVELNGFRAVTFNGFIEHVLHRRPGFLGRLYDFYTREAHFVGHQERMAPDLCRVLRFLRVSVDEARLLIHRPTNVSEPADVRLDTSLRQSLEDAERDAFERYGYAASTPSVSAYAGLARLSLPAPAAHDAGHAWHVRVPDLARFADTELFPKRSLLSLLENGTPIGPAHQCHDDIRRLGQGRLSHWNDGVLFSTSDNSNPNENGRRYEVVHAFPAPPDSTHLMLTDQVTSSPEPA
jgi:hypothetical protein